MKSIFKTLRKAGIPRHDLYLAWDFTVASKRSTAGRMLRIATTRSPSWATPTLTTCGSGRVAAVQRDLGPTPTPAEDAEIERIVTGTVRVPCYLQAPGLPGRQPFNLGADGLPVQKPGNVIDAPFRCVIPRGLAAGEGRALIYGHGLLGNPLDSGSSAQGQLKTLAVQKKFVVCGTYWIGLSDLPRRAPGDARTSARPPKPRRTSRTSRRWSTACSRACSTTSTSGGRWFIPRASARTPASSSAGSR